MDYNFHWRPVVKALPSMLEGAALTLQVAVEGIVLGIAAGLLLALARRSGRRPQTAVATGWIELARNTPVLFQLYAVYFGLGALGLHLSSHVAMAGALAFNNGGYLAETFRGGFLAVPANQQKAARSLGMTFMQAQLQVVIPQVLRVVYYPLTNQFILSILVSSLGLFIGLRELAGETQFLASKSFRTFEYFLVASVIYYMLAKLALLASRLAARRLFRSEA